MRHTSPLLLMKEMSVMEKKCKIGSRLVRDPALRSALRRLGGILFAVLAVLSTTYA